MGKTAFLFAGQGAQYVGMGKDLYDNFEEVRKVFGIASESIGMDIRELCFNGSSESLNETENTQPAVVTMSLAVLSVLQRYGIKADVSAGLSLGEYCAYTYSGAFTVEKVIPLVKKRGRFMQEAVPQGKGKMVAILGLDEEKVKAICEQSSQKGVVEAANFNCPGQIVIGGQVSAVDFANEMAKNNGAKTIVLPVSAPFHTSMLSSAAEKLGKELEKIELGEMKTPVVTNVTAEYINDKNRIKAILKKQVESAVLWQQCIEKMINDGVSTFVEIGPGKTLSSFVRKINREVLIYNAQDITSLNKTLQAIGGE